MPSVTDPRTCRMNQSKSPRKCKPLWTHTKRPLREQACLLSKSPTWSLKQLGRSNSIYFLIRNGSTWSSSARTDYYEWKIRTELKHCLRNSVIPGGSWRCWPDDQKRLLILSRSTRFKGAGLEVEALAIPRGDSTE